MPHFAATPWNTLKNSIYGGHTLLWIWPSSWWLICRHVHGSWFHVFTWLACLTGEAFHSWAVNSSPFCMYDFLFSSFSFLFRINTSDRLDYQVAFVNYHSVCAERKRARKFDQQEPRLRTMTARQTVHFMCACVCCFSVLSYWNCLWSSVNHKKRKK